MMCHPTSYSPCSGGGCYIRPVLSARLDGLKALEAAAKPLYAVLTDDQKKLADRLLSGPMGMM
jgi:hypothetical protein